jgi:hypothetical protein
LSSSTPLGGGDNLFALASDNKSRAMAQAKLPAIEQMADLCDLFQNLVTPRLG